MASFFTHKTKEAADYYLHNALELTPKCLDSTPKAWEITPKPLETLIIWSKGTNRAVDVNY